ncbi:MAG: hypothetical protein GX963_10015 [Bacteroidales bacterium]|nr:hypothetical protein [Bacteroidales bacterium]
MTTTDKILQFEEKARDYEIEKDYPNAIKYYTKAYDLAIKQEDVSIVIPCGPLEKLSKIYHKLKMYEKEIEALDILINEYMEDNRKRTEEYIARFPDMEDLALDALETNTTILDKHAEPPFPGKTLLQYNVKKYIDRREKLKHKITK